MKSIKLKNRWNCQNYDIIIARRGCLCRKSHATNFAPKTMAVQSSLSVEYIAFAFTFSQISSNIILKCIKTCSVVVRCDLFGCLTKPRHNAHTQHTCLTGNCVNKFVRMSLLNVYVRKFITNIMYHYCWADRKRSTKCTHRLSNVMASRNREVEKKKKKKEKNAVKEISRPTIARIFRHPSKRPPIQIKPSDGVHL